MPALLHTLLRTQAVSLLVCPSVRPSVRLSVCPSVRLSVGDLGGRVGGYVDRVGRVLRDTGEPGRGEDGASYLWVYFLTSLRSPQTASATNSQRGVPIVRAAVSQHFALLCCTLHTVLCCVVHTCVTRWPLSPSGLMVWKPRSCVAPISQRSGCRRTCLFTTFACSARC